MTLRRTVPSPTYEETLSGGFAACRQSRYSAKLFHVHGTSSVPARPERCFFQSALVAVLDRGEGHAVQPEVFGGHALHDLAVHDFPGEERQFRMAVPVHEAGAERLAVHILHAAGAGRGAGGEHGGDGAAFHAHITVEPRVARARR